MESGDSYKTLSNTRGVPLNNLAGLCFTLAESRDPLSVKDLANEAIRREILDFEPISVGMRLPTRIHHHMIALRKLGLVSTRKDEAYIYYDLTDAGYALYRAVQEKYPGSGKVEMDDALRASWRPILVSNAYVRYHWLQYFMCQEDFTYQELLMTNRFVTLYRIPIAERLRPKEDSGYRLQSECAEWEDEGIDNLAYKEIFQGLRRWTNEVYLTDDRLPEGYDTPYIYQSNNLAEHKIESYIVKSWLDGNKDLDLFVHLVDGVLDENGSDRIPIPTLIIELCYRHDYSKYNIRYMLDLMYEHKGSDYFFERGSEFLIQKAFDISQPQDYYVKIDGIWRTGLVRYR